MIRDRPVTVEPFQFLSAEPGAYELSYFDKRSIIKPGSKQVVRVCGIARSIYVGPEDFPNITIDPPTIKRWIDTSPANYLP